MTFTLDQLMNAVIWIVLTGASTILLLVGVILRWFTGRQSSLSTRVEALENEHERHKVHVIENYVKASDLRVIIDPVFRKLDRMEDKINGIGFQLAEKQDRPR